MKTPKKQNKRNTKGWVRHTAEHIIGRATMIMLLDVVHNAMPPQAAAFEIANALARVSKQLAELSDVAWEVFEQGKLPTKWPKNSLRRHISELCIVARANLDKNSKRTAKLID